MSSNRRTIDNQSINQSINSLMTEMSVAYALPGKITLITQAF